MQILAIIVAFSINSACQRRLSPPAVQPEQITGFANNPPNQALQFEKQKLAVLELELTQAVTEQSTATRLLRRTDSESLTQLERLAIEERIKQAKATRLQIEKALDEQRKVIKKMTKQR